MDSKPHLRKSFVVIAADPDADWRLHRVDVDAISDDEAKAAARAELASVQRDHWSIRLVREKAA